MLRRSSSAANNSAAPSATNWRSSRDYGASYSSNSNEPNYRQLSMPGSQSFRADRGLNNQDSRGSMDSMRSFTRRTPSFSPASVPSQHRSPVQIIVIDTIAPPREPNPRPSQAAPRPPEHWHFPHRHTEERHPRPSSHTIKQPNKALESLRKEFYNPNTKRFIKTVNLYYRDTPVNPRDFEEEEEGKRCAVCLEDFERGQEVMLTPCKHMFHEDCIVPWARSNPHCPVCRSSFGPKPGETSSALPFSGAGNSGNPGLSTPEFLSILSALGEGFRWG